MKIGFKKIFGNKKIPKGSGIIFTTCTDKTCEELTATYNNTLDCPVDFFCIECNTMICNDEIDFRPLAGKSSRPFIPK